LKSGTIVYVIYLLMIKRSLTRSATKKKEFRLIKTRNIARICKSSSESLYLQKSKPDEIQYQDE